MPEYLNTEWTGPPITVARSDRLNLPGNWTTITFDHDISDTSGHHSETGDQASIGNGARFCHGVLDFQLIGGNPGEEIQIRQYEVNGAGDRVETSKADEFYLSSRTPPLDPQGNELYPRSRHKRWPVFANINSGHRLRVELTRWDLDGPDLTIAQAQFTGNYF